MLGTRERHDASVYRVRYALASPAALSLVCALELVLQKRALAMEPTLLLAALTLLLGTLHGAVWDATFALLARASVGLRASFWGLASLGGAVWLARALGLLGRIDGEYASLAWSAIAALVIGAAAFTALLCALQPTAARSSGLLDELPTSLRRVAVVAFASGAGAGFIADSQLYVGLYPALHTALRAASLFLCMLAFAATDALPKIGRHARSLLGALGVLLLGAIVLDAHLGAQSRTLLDSTWSGAVLEAAQTLSDFDFDGYSQTFGGGDCAPFDPRIHPGAAEIPDNGKDDNCLLGDRKSRPKRHGRARGTYEPRAPMSVVLITVDSLRADHLGLYDARYAADQLATTPHLDAFSKQARVYDAAFTAGGWTSISLSALMRGVYPRALDFRRVYETNRYNLLLKSERKKLKKREHFAKMFPLPRSDTHETLPSLLSRNGVYTTAIVNDEYAEILAKSSGVAPGFTAYRDLDDLQRQKRDDKHTSDRAIAELKRIPTGKPFFLWVHFFGPHTPTRIHSGVRLDGTDLAAGYDHEIRYLDRHLHRLLRATQKRRDKLAVFVTADHGEEFFGNARHHGYSLDSSVVRVPLIAKVPGWSSGRVSRAVSLIDLMPTFLDLTRTKRPAEQSGRNLRLAFARRHARTRIVFSDTWQFDGRGVKVRAQTAAMDGTRRVVFDPLRGDFVLYDPDVEHGVPRQIEPTSRDPLVRALAKYVESGDAPKLRD